MKNLFSGTEGEGVKNLQTCVMSFMDDPLVYWTKITFLNCSHIIILKKDNPVGVLDDGRGVRGEEVLDGLAGVRGGDLFTGVHAED